MLATNARENWIGALILKINDGYGWRKAMVHTSRTLLLVEKCYSLADDLSRLIPRIQRAAAGTL